MRKFKLIYSNYDEITGISTAIISTPLGEFKGTSKLHKEDLDKASSFAGCEYAETRAILKYMKARIKIISIKIETLERFQNLLKSMSKYEHNSIENRKLRHQLFIIKKEKNKMIENYKSLSSKLLDKMAQREKVIKKINERMNTNGE